MQSDDNIKYKKRDEGQLGDFGNTTPANSFSGGETDHLFLSSHGEQFYDLDLLTGLAHPGDGRTASLLDYDRDGWIDIVVSSANAPTVQLYRNHLGRAHHADAPGARMIALRFVGGNRTAQPSTQWAPRNGYGAMVEIDVGEAPLVREHRCGDGRATQHSATMHVGIGEDEVRGLTVRWPSGRRQVSPPIAPGTLVTIYENPADSPTGDVFVTEPYLRRVLDQGTERESQRLTKSLEIDLPATDDPGPFNVVVAMSTHCKSCKKAQPQVQLLREAFAREGIGFYAVGTDLEETGEELAAYVRDHHPQYDVLTDLPLAQRRALKRHVIDTYKDDLTPVTVVLDNGGRILKTMPGVPTVSDLRKLTIR